MKRLSKETIKLLEEGGAKIESVRRNKHVVFTLTRLDGSTGTITKSATSSDCNTALNNAAEVRRALISRSPDCPVPSAGQ